MPQVNLLGVQQNFDFNTKKVRNFVVFEFDGKHIHAEIENVDEVATLLNAGLNGEAAPAPTPAAPGRVDVHVVPQPPVPPEDPREDTDRVVDWTKIPEDVVSREMKVALQVLNVPHLIQATELRNLMDSIMEEFTEEDWAPIRVSLGTDVISQAQEVAQVAVQAPQTTRGFQPTSSVPHPAATPAPRPAAPVQRPRAAPAVGEVTWHDGSPILPGAGVHARTVPADEFGYPIVSNAGVDPGEVVGDGDERDEDGVGQF